MNPTIIIITLGWAVIGFLAGCVIGVALKKSVAPIGILQALLIALGWSSGWAIGNIIWNSMQMAGMIYQDFPFNYAIVGTTAGIIGGGCTLLIIYWAHASG